MRDNWFTKISIILIGLIIGIVLDPIFWIGIVFAYLPALIHKARDWFKNRRY
jgi:hypothetical protein